MSDNPPPAYALDYVILAQVVSLGYIAPDIARTPITIGVTDAQLATYIGNSRAAGDFTAAELATFTNNYRFIGSLLQMANSEAAGWASDGIGGADLPAGWHEGC